MIQAHAKSGCSRGLTQNERANRSASNGGRSLGDSAMSRESRQYGSESTTSSPAVVR